MRARAAALAPRGPAGRACLGGRASPVLDELDLLAAREVPVERDRQAIHEGGSVTRQDEEMSQHVSPQLQNIAAIVRRDLPSARWRNERIPMSGGITEPGGASGRWGAMCRPARCRAARSRAARRG